MGTLARYPDWGLHSRNTDPSARVCRFRRVNDVRAVRVTGGSFRSAPADGVFELYEPELPDPVEVKPSGKRLVKVICAWRGGKPNGSGIGASINLSAPGSRAEVLEHYSGEVVDNIGYPDDPVPLIDDEPAVSTRPMPEPSPVINAPPVYAADLDAPPSRIETTVSRIVRDTELSAWVKQLHNYRCQLCGETIRLADGSGYAEGHHLRPLGKPHDGPDVAENIVCVCPNHHASCDLGAIRLELALLRSVPDHRVGERFVAYHNEVVFRE